MTDSMTTLQWVYFAAGVLLLPWAFAARHSRFDAILLVVLSVLLLLLGLGWETALRFRQSYMFPEIVLGLLGAVLFVRAFLSRLPALHRVGFGLVGCATMLPLLLLMALIAAFMA